MTVDRIMRAFQSADATRALLADSVEDDLSHALRALLWHFEPDEGALPDLDVLDRWTAAPRLGSFFAADAAARAAFLSGDSALHRAWLDGLRRLGRDHSSSPWLALVELRQAYMDGRAVPDDAKAVEHEAASAKLPVVVVEAAAMRALLELEATPPAGVETARRASRMARTEALGLCEYLAHLVLARARRFQARPHLATRILLALAELVPRPWLDWIGFELALAGRADVARELEAGHARTAALLRVLDSAATATPEECDALRTEVAGTHSLARDVDVLLALMGRAPPHDPEAAPWCEGRTDIVPRGLFGAALSPGARGLVAGYVVAARGAPGLRVLAAARPPRAAVLESSRPGRAETLLCALLLSPALSGSDLFRAVYGFDYVREIHKGPFEVLVHRARAFAADLVEIVRADDRFTARAMADVAVADPRCIKSLDERLLEVIAELRVGTARHAAERLGLPLRTVQVGLQQLVSDGGCIAEEDGRRLAYRIEDTTFSEPTAASIRRRVGGARSD